MTLLHVRPLSNTVSYVRCFNIHFQTHHHTPIYSVNTNGNTFRPSRAIFRPLQTTNDNPTYNRPLNDGFCVCLCLRL